MEATRYGIAEWYGHSFISLSKSEKLKFAGGKSSSFACPFQKSAQCSKAGGVCSLRKYERLSGDSAAPIEDGQIVSLCPNRFLEADDIYRWIGSEVLGSERPRIAKEIPFLVGQDKDARETKNAVGRIDAVLVHPDPERLEWCALEIQSVYFSGAAMGKEFEFIRQHSSGRPHWPRAIRRPDFRSSGPKRLMPQLQIKVPTISRWGRKMAVVVDRAFFESLGRMEEVSDTSNADILWFVVDFMEEANKIKLVRHQLARTTLDRAVEGLTGGHPVSKQTFEQTLRAKLG